MDNKIRDIIYITDYLTKCKIDDPNSEKSELARKILNCQIKKMIYNIPIESEYDCHQHIEPLKRNKSLLNSLISIIF